MQEKSKPPGSTQYVASSCWDGDHYRNRSEWQFRVATIALNYIELPSKAKVLDIGCGDGRFTKFLANRIPEGEVIGLDPSPSMLAAAQANVSSNLSFVQGDAVSLPFNNQFDRIMAFNSLHWVSEIVTALEQIRKALKPQGQVLILVAPTQVRHPIHQIINEVAKRKHWAPYFDKITNIFSFYTLAEWATLIEEAKLIPECLQLMDASLDYPDKNSFADFVAGWIPYGAIPEDKRRDYVHDVVESYITTTPCSSTGIVHYHMDELVIVASKKK